ncbi:MAG: glycosyltransferase family protein [Chloroflexota bacterium]|nr:MAG: hypothetical protein DLM70_13165 [Chloroflexota bacterium]
MHFAPDVVLVDHAPRGMKGEVLPALHALQRVSPATRIVLGLRDVLDEPEKVRRQWAGQDTYRTIEEFYDRILIYGQADLFNPVEAYAFPPALTARTRFCGYIQREDPIHLAPAPRAELGLDDAPFVLVTTGGGGDGAMLEETCLDALALLRRGQPVQAVVITGPLMALKARDQLEKRARSLAPAIRLLPFHRDIPGLMRASSLVVAMGGYNTLCEIVSSGCPAVVVPRAHPRLEQHIRAHAFAARGLIHMLSADDLSPVSLACAMGRALHEGPATSAIRAEWDGAGLVRIASEFAGLLPLHRRARNRAAS